MPNLGFQGRRLTQARKVRMLTQKSLAALVDKSSQVISQYEAGKVEPPYAVAQEMAEVLHVPVALFYKPWEDHGSEAPVFYRSMAAATKRAREAAQSKLEWIDDVVAYFEDNLELPAFSGCNFGLPDDPMLIDNGLIEDVALRLREEWGLGEEPIDNMIGILERHGVFVFKLPLGADTLDALSASWNSAHPYIVIGTDKGNPFRWRFDAAHELGHLVMHRNVPEISLRTPTLNKAMENQANRFASAFLMPEQPFLDSLIAVNLDSYKQMKPYWRCSIQAMIRRTRDLGIIGDEDYRRLNIGISRRKWRQVEPFDQNAPEERPALARKCLAVIQASFDESEDAFYNVTCLPEDFGRELFGDAYKRHDPRGAVILNMPNTSGLHVV